MSDGKSGPTTGIRRMREKRTASVAAAVNDCVADESPEPNSIRRVRAGVKGTQPRLAVLPGAQRDFDE
jgi:hypothetical protein